MLLTKTPRALWLLALCCLCSSASPMTVIVDRSSSSSSPSSSSHDSSPSTAASSSNPSYALNEDDLDPFGTGPTPVATIIDDGDDDDSTAAAAASPSGNFESFGGFSGPKALIRLVDLSNFGDSNNQYASSDFEDAYSQPNRRSDKGRSSEYSGQSLSVPVRQSISVAPASAPRYNTQVSSGYASALSAAPVYTGARAVAAAPAYYAAPTAAPAPAPYGVRAAYVAPASYVATAAPAYGSGQRVNVYPVAPVSGYPRSLSGAAAAPLWRSAAVPMPVSTFHPAPVGALPLQPMGYAAPLYPPHASASYALPTAAPGFVSAPRYSVVRVPGLNEGGSPANGYGSTQSASQRRLPSSAAPQAPDEDFGGFGFGSELNDSPKGDDPAGGFNFGSEEF